MMRRELSRELLFEIHSMMRAGHRELWAWLSLPENDKWSKGDWPGWATWVEYVELLKEEAKGNKFLQDIIKVEVFSSDSLCFGCMWSELNRSLLEEYPICSEFCLFIWPGYKDCSHRQNLYARWYRDKERGKLAKEISMLPTVSYDYFIVTAEEATCNE